MKNIPIDGVRERLIFALDLTEDLTETLSWAERLKGHVGMFKVGQESFTRYGPEVVARIHQGGGKVFLDLKYHDIPQTVARAAEAAVEMGVAMFNVHALGGKEMIREAVRATEHKAEQLRRPKPVLLAVTVLTSLNNSDLEALGFRSPLEEIVVKLACLAREEGASGVVASPQDILAVRKACGPDFLIVTPGIRAPDHAGDDQKRTLSPGEAVRLGADYLVVGRPIRRAADPVLQAEAMVQEMSGAISQ